MTPRRARDLMRKYGLLASQYQTMLVLQQHRCAICREPFKRNPNVDHDHKTGRVRGLLCYRCNHILLGRGRENPEHHERAARYLRSSFDGRKIC